MKVALVIVIFYIVACIGENSTEKRKKRQTEEGTLSQPVPAKCAARSKEFQHKGKNYFLSNNVPELSGKKVDWLESRNLCRQYCMDLVSLESQEENDMINLFIKSNNIASIWTSGRLCDFKGCDDPDLEPKNINGWFWSTSLNPIEPTNRTPSGWSYNPWSQTGHKKKPQPDNAEYDINETPESCLSVQNNVYNDGVRWHDAACYHEKVFICKDSDELLAYVNATNPELRL